MHAHPQIEAKADEIAVAAAAPATKNGSPPARDREAAGADEQADLPQPDGTAPETGAVKNGATLGATLLAVRVPKPDLRRFNRLLSSHYQGEVRR